MTGNREDILGISFGKKDNTENNIEVIEWKFPNIDNSKIRTSKTEVLNQVLLGVNIVNQALGTNYTVSKIYYVPAGDPSQQIYKNFTISIIDHYHKNGEF